MSAYNSVVATKSELALMGMTQYVDSNEEGKDIIKYICKTLEADCDLSWFDPKSHKMRAVVTNRLEDMRLLTVALETEEDKGKFNLLDEDGCFCYVMNLDVDYFSEFGYSYFAKRNGLIKRIA